MVYGFLIEIRLNNEDKTNLQFLQDDVKENYGEMLFIMRYNK